MEYIMASRLRNTPETRISALGDRHTPLPRPQLRRFARRDALSEFGGSSVRPTPPQLHFSLESGQ